MYIPSQKLKNLYLFSIAYWYIFIVGIYPINALTRTRREDCGRWKFVMRSSMIRKL
jgi:hypothetical protein